MPTQLSVNLNKIALIRNSRGRDFPSVVHFAHLALKAGAHGVTIHPRPDQRHARYADVAALKAVVDAYPGSELNVEGYPDRTFLDVVLAAKPQQCTLVPDEPGQLTSDHGWHIERDLHKLAPIVAELKAAGIRVSLFVDPDAEQIALAPATGCDRVELYTESFAHQHELGDFTFEFARFAEAAAAATQAGLGINAGHDLNLDNLGDFLVIPDILEVSIGHALTVEALQYGFEATIARYVAILKAAH
ncbi:Pyridoxine 5'-phosphate synthase [Andreprevotia sp. IGB-42]|uniref:pyridoxine 5'-phosphate synthase n=1 Tax=Andreprevotia sp. IGB-42 TaxID=2497473 RepID=UPI0013578B86|nr:pyridoxine 5'-phosphate synthase [Andreprevotia sp. IGB-42]KAF0811354.1 Pyridoxine 5'-phosphate synthase [Andreprevotia sp. IGB-42]